MPEILGTLKPPRLSVPPSSPALGQMYYDTVLSQLLYWDGTKWNQGPAGTVYDSDYVGTVKAFAGPAIPTNWMLCDGRTLDKTLYPELFTAIGYKYGGSGNNFVLPDLRSKFIYGVTQADLSDLGAVGGLDVITLAIANLPSHSHGGSTGTDTPDHAHSGSTSTAGAHTHVIDTGTNTLPFAASSGATGQLGSGGTSRFLVQDWGGTTSDGNHSHTFTTAGASARHAHSIPAEGSGQSHTNIPPFLRLSQIIKVTGAQINAGGALVGPTGPKGADSTVPGPQGPQGPAGPGVPTGGSTGQVLTKTSGVDFATSWQAVPAAGHTVQDEGTPLTFRPGLNFIGPSVTVTDDVGNNRTNVTITPEVYEQPGQPSSTTVGAVWIDTDDVAPVYQGNPLVTSLPSNPADGQEVHYLADAANGVIWHLKYRAASTSAYKWEFVGGSSLLSIVDTDQNCVSAGYADLATIGPAVTVPLAGDYQIELGSQHYSDATGAFAYHSFQIGATAAVDADGSSLMWIAGANVVQDFKRIQFKTLTANTALVSKYKVSRTSNFRFRHMRVTPVRVS